MPSMSRQDCLINNGTDRMFWTVSYTSYDLRLEDIEVHGSLPGHLHLHTNTKAKRLQVYLLLSSGWKDVSGQYLSGPFGPSSTAIRHPTHSNLFLTHLANDVYEPRYVILETAQS